MSNLSVVTGNTDPILVLSATGTGASATTFVHDSAAENNYPGQLFPSVFEFAITDIVGVFSGLAVNLEWSPITATGTPQFQTVGTWTPLVSPVVFFPCSATGTYRLNVTSFVGGTSFNVYASIASSMPQGSGGGGGGGSVTQGTVPWVVSFNAPQHVIVDSGGGGGVQYADNAASGATPTGTLASGWDSVNSKVRALKVDASQNLLVALNAALPAGTNVIGHVVVDSFGTTIDVSDRAARLLGVVYGSQAQQLKQTATNFNLQVELAAGGTLYDARQIRALTSADVVDVSDRTARILGHVIVDSGAVTVSGTVAVSNPDVQFVDAAASGTHPTGTLAMGWNTNNSQIVGLRTDPNDNLYVNITNSTGQLTSSQPVFARTALDVNILSVHDVGVTAAAALADNLPNPTAEFVGANNLGWDSTNSVWRRLQVVTGTGIIEQQTFVEAAGVPVAWTGLNLAGVNPGHVAVVDNNGVQIGYSAAHSFVSQIASLGGQIITANSSGGIGNAVDTNLMKIQGQSLPSPGIPIIDFTSGTQVAVKQASTAAIATDPALVVALSPNTSLFSTLPTNAAQETGNLATIAANTGRQATTDVLMQILAALDAVNFNLGKIIGDYTDRFDLQTAQGV